MLRGTRAQNSIGNLVRNEVAHKAQLQAKETGNQLTWPPACPGDYSAQQHRDCVKPLTLMAQGKEQQLLHVLLFTKHRGVRGEEVM